MPKLVRWNRGPWVMIEEVGARVVNAMDSASAAVWKRS